MPSRVRIVPKTFFRPRVKIFGKIHGMDAIHKIGSCGCSVILLAIVVAICLKACSAGAEVIAKRTANSIESAEAVALDLCDRLERERGIRFDEVESGIVAARKHVQGVHSPYGYTYFTATNSTSHFEIIVSVMSQTGFRIWALEYTNRVSTVDTPSHTGINR